METVHNVARSCVEYAETQNAIDSITGARENVPLHGSADNSEEAQSSSMVTIDILPFCKCSMCNEVFQNTIVPDEDFVIDLNRAVQCHCGCNMCKSCYQSNNGRCQIKGHTHMQSNNAPVNSVIVDLMNKVDVQHNLTDITDPEDQGPSHYEDPCLVTETIAAIAGPEMDLPQGNFLTYYIMWIFFT